MEKHGLNIWINIKPWFIGVLLSSIGMFLGYDLGSQIASLLGGEPGIWSRMGKGFVWGGVIAGFQWPIIRSIGVFPIQFILVSAIGFAVGYPLGQTIQLIMTFHWNLHYLGYGSAIAIFGLSLGIPQWWICRRHMQYASVWILFSVIGWMLTGISWISFAGVNTVEDAIAYGIVTGPSLTWLVHSQQTSVKAIEA